MRTLLVLVLTFGFPNLALSQTPDNNEYTYPEGRVKFRMDPKPKYERSIVKTKSGEQLVVTISASKSSDLILTISYSDLQDTGNPLDADKVYDSTIKAMGKSATMVEGRLIAGTDNTPPGREVLFRHGKITTRARLFLDGHRLYIVSAVGSASKVQDKTAQALFQHFAIVSGGK